MSCVAYKGSQADTFSQELLGPIIVTTEMAPGRN